MMLRTGDMQGVMRLPPNDPRRLMVTGGDSAELAEVQDRTPGATGPRTRGGEDRNGDGVRSTADTLETGNEEPGFWQSGWGQGIGIVGAGALTNFAFGDRSIGGTIRNTAIIGALALPVMNAEDGPQRLLNGMGTIFNGIKDGNGDGIRAGFGEIGGVYSDGINNLTGLDMRRAFGGREPGTSTPTGTIPGMDRAPGGDLVAGRDSTMALGERTLSAHLDSPAPGADLARRAPTVPTRTG
jgi:hypothetical protein